MFKKALLFFIVVLFSCEHKEEYIESSLLKYYLSFQAEAKRLQITLPNKSVLLYTVEHLDSRGLCKTRKNYCEISINANLLPKDPNEFSYKLEGIIFHELGHGLLNRDDMHPTCSLEESKYLYPESLMTVRHYGRDRWNDKRDHYINELFELK